MTSSLIFDLVARDKGFDSTMDGSAKAAERLAKQLQDAGRRSGQGFATAARQIGATLEQIERDAWEAGNATDDAFKAAVREMRSDFERLRQAGRMTGASLESGLGDALRDLKSRVDDFADTASKKSKQAAEDVSGSFSDAFDGVSDLLGDAFGDVGGSILDGIGSAKGGLLAAGAAAAGALFAGLQAEMQEDKIGALIAAQTGSAVGQAEMLGDVVGDVFASGVGESVEQVGEALTAALNFKLVDTSEPEAAIERITEKVVTLGTVTGASADEIGRAARNLLVNGLAGNVTQALDMIQHASDVGLNYADDLFDTISEYSIHFHDLGLDGAEAFGLISQAAQGGARDTDYAADALKEFQIRAQDMSDTTRRGFESIGLNADAMGRKIAAGGTQAHDALRQTLNALQAMPSDIERNSAAVDLFGTKAEDLGQAFYRMDLDNAAEEFGDFGGSVEEAVQKLEAGRSGIDKFNSAVDTVKGNLGEFLDWLGSSSGLDEFESQINEIAVAQEKWLSTGDSSWLDDLKEKYPELSGKIDEYIEKTRDEVTASNNVSAAVEGQVNTIDDLINKHRELAGGVLDLSAAHIQNQEALAAANEAFAQNGANLDLATEGGRENQKTLNGLVDSTYDVVTAMRAQGATSTEVAGFVQAQRDQYIRLATAMGMDAQQAQNMANKLGLIPGNYTANVVLSGIEYARQRAADFKRLLDSIPNSKTVNLRVSAQGGGHNLAGMASGGPVEEGTPYIVGEKGYELFVPDTDGVIVPHEALRSSAGAFRPANRVGATGESEDSYRMGVNVSLAAGAGGDAGVGQWIQGLVRRGILKLTVDSSGRVQAG